MAAVDRAGVEIEVVAQKVADCGVDQCPVENLFSGMPASLELVVTVLEIQQQKTGKLEKENREEDKKRRERERS